MPTSAGDPSTAGGASTGDLPASVVETHISTLFFVGDRAYKLKKPVRFPFLDLTTRAAREELCHREVELNRRLSPDVYLGVADVTGPDGAPCDHLVVMRRLPDERRLARLVVADDPVVPGQLRALAAQLARFHAAAPRSPAIDAAATVDAVAALWRENFDAMRDAVPGLLDARALADAEARSDAYLTGRAALFDERIASGAVCDGHGDLQADDVFCLDDGPRVLDCIEFNDAFRFGDVANDVAFLVMDLVRLARPDLAIDLLTAYEREAGTTLPRSLVHFYTAYRAQVRAKVACLRAAQEDPASADFHDSAERARVLLDLCGSQLRHAQPRLVLVGGAPGTGKSTVARAIGEAFGWPVVRSDVVRKEMAGVDPTRPTSAATGGGGSQTGPNAGAGIAIDSGLYAAEMTAAVYAAMLERASASLRLGASIVLDATFLDERFREQARVAAGASGAGIVEVCCVLDPAVADRRMEARAAQGTDPSDATPAVARSLRARAAPWPEARALATEGDRDAVALRARRLLEVEGALPADRLA